MHPAPSIITFTVLSGLGFGLMIWLGIAPGAKGTWVAGTFCVLAIGLASAGLIASTFHLGHPERAWKALSQWRSSWLSREGVAAVLTLGVFALYSAVWVLTGTAPTALGWLVAALALGTVICTAMIYAQMKTVPRWHDPLTPALFVLFAVTGGALLAGQMRVAALLTAGLAVAQIALWLRGDRAFAAAGSTPETATGLGAIGRVRLLEAPHTGPNYLMTEMVFRIGRKHAVKLRVIAMAFLLLPAALSATVDVGHMLAVPVVLSHLAGVAMARWLFFAEAEHVVGLYYGQR